MKKDTFRNLIDFSIMAAMLFGWISMLSGSAFSLLRYGFYIFGISTLVLAFVSQKRAINSRIFMGIIIFGMFSLCQPFTIALYRCGFQTLLVGTLAFIIISHMKIETLSVTHQV